MKKVGFIGGGNMAGAIIKGLLAGPYVSDDVIVSDAAEGARRRLKRAYKVEATKDNSAVVENARVIVLAVKPQAMADVLAGIRPTATPKKLFVSIAAGFPLARLEQGLGGAARVVRVMPNAPALLGKGMSVAVAGSHATKADVTQTLNIFRAVGEAVSIEGEGLLDAVTGLSGSGPAFVYYFAEHLIEGGVRGGLTQRLATQLAFQTIAGASAMLLESGKSPRDLREMVASPGGTTHAGLAAMDEHGFRQTVVAAVDAATRRARELASA